MKRDIIVNFLEDYLRVKDFEDHCVNGLQIEGEDEVKKIITGVSLSQELIRKAIEKEAQMIMVHHGIFDSSLPNPLKLKGHMRERIAMLLKNDINLLGFHLPLDAHAEIGNNISLLNLFGLEKTGSLKYKSVDIGYIGEYKEAVDINDFVKMVNEKLNTNSYTILKGSKNVKKVGIISGGASPEYLSALEQGVGTYVSGDIHEFLVRSMEEEGINYINAKHYNTEKMGIQNLGELLKEKFEIDVEFVDVPCDI